MCKVPLQNEDMLLNFVAWEQGLRRNLTVDMWKLNPSELAGSWYSRFMEDINFYSVCKKVLWVPHRELIDVGGVGSLNSIMTQATENYFDVSPVVRPER